MTMRLNCGCGPKAAAGWLNCDLICAPGIDVRCDIRAGLPFASNSIGYAVAMHVLQDLPWAEIAPALAELNRVLRPGGILRLGLPDLERALAAYQRGDPAYFHVPDADAKSLGGKLVTQMIWYGSVRTPFVFDFIEELLLGADFLQVARCAYQQTQSVYPDIVALDNRPRETLFVEAGKPA
jgi:SAM-dependent methyltransferase